MPTVYLYHGLGSYHGNWQRDDYYYENFYNDYSISSSRGFGIGANNKRFLNKKEFIYCHAGIDHSFRKVNFSHYEFIPYKENGMTYYRYDKLYQKQNFNQVILATCLRLQSPMEYGFYIDDYLGTGYKYAFYDKNKPTLDKGINDYGYHGIYPAVGLLRYCLWRRKTVKGYEV